MADLDNNQMVIALINEILEDNIEEELIFSDENNYDAIYREAVLKFNSIKKRVERGESNAVFFIKYYIITYKIICFLFSILFLFLFLVRIKDYFTSVIPHYQEDTFRRHFRMGRESFDKFVDIIMDCPQFVQRNQGGRKANDRTIQTNCDIFMVHGK